MHQRDVAFAVAAVSENMGATPRLGIVLGSGWAPLADAMDVHATIPYSDIPGFPVVGVEGHAGRLLFGNLHGCDVVVLCGRKHFYEQRDHHHMNLPVAVLKELGCETLLLTNASGAVNPEITVGSIAMISDHINLASVSPLSDEPYFDDLFVDLTDAYDPSLRAMFRDAAKQADIVLPEGVYACFAGPHYETPAEIRMAAGMGADLVGMSTVAETILARRLGMRVVALSIATNAAAGMSDEPLLHEAVQEKAVSARDNAMLLLKHFISRFKEGSS